MSGPATIPDNNEPLPLEVSPDPSITDEQWAGLRKIANMMNRVGRGMKGPRRSLPPAHDEYVYFARCGSRIKIGTSKNPRKRIASLATAQPEPIVLLKTIRGGAREERRLHEMFRDLHIRGEWFRFAEPLASYIDRATHSAVEHEIIL